MKITSIAAVAAATAAMALTGTVAEAKDKKHDDHHRWEHSSKGHPHGMPPGQRKKMERYYNTGQHLPRTYYSNNTYYVRDYDRYNLRVAPPGYQWVRVGNDVYLAQTRTGLIADIVRSIFD
jgi:Ni/Co efflux regulator RcnB